MLVPEFTLKGAIDSFLNYIRADLITNASTPNNSFLYQVIQTVGLERYDIFTQISSVISQPTTDQRYLECDLMYNMKMEKLPHLYIRSAIRESKSSDGLGIDEGLNYDFIDYIDINGSHTKRDNLLIRRFNTSLALIITTNNSIECLGLYYVLRSLFISLHEHLNISGFENLKLGGGDLEIYSDLAPKNFYTKTITFDFETDVQSLNATTTSVFKDIIFTQILNQTT